MSILVWLLFARLLASHPSSTPSFSPVVDDSRRPNTGIGQVSRSCRDHSSVLLRSPLNFAENGLQLSHASHAKCNIPIRGARTESSSKYWAIALCPCRALHLEPLYRPRVLWYFFRRPCGIQPLQPLYHIVGTCRASPDMLGEDR